LLRADKPSAHRFRTSDRGLYPRVCSLQVESNTLNFSVVEHDPVGNPVSTFPEHARGTANLAGRGVGAAPWKSKRKIRTMKTPATPGAFKTSESCGLRRC